MRTFLLLAVATFVGACQGAETNVAHDTAVGKQEQAIIGGTENNGDPAVVAVFAGGLCTGTLIAPEIVLTAAHCVSSAIESGNTNSGTVRFGSGGSDWFDSINIVDMAMHRLYKPPAFLQHDIALVRLASPADIAPLVISRRNLTDDDVGLVLRVVGFGNTDGVAGTGAGRKRQVTLSLNEVRPRHIIIGDRLYNTCQGDSGGPTFAEFDGQEIVVGVTSYGAGGCQGASALTRTDAMWDEFLTEVISAWSGPCMQDGVCIEDDSCAYPDPDCDPCGMDGFCIRDCPIPDKDCALEGLAGETCGSDLGCESRNCTTAIDDDRIQFCSMSCDPAVAFDKSGCFAPLTICEDLGNGQGQCRFPGITPGVQGAPCQDGGICRSGMCDTDEEICVEACGDGLPECSKDFECLKLGDLRVCSIPGDPGCSVANGNGAGLGGLLLLLALAFGANRRRRRR